jgi:hypothetical protein
VLTFAGDGSWFRLPGGETFAIDRRPARRVLLALVRRRRSVPGGFVDADALLEAGWPGERPLREAGLNRVYATVSGLRRVGLRDFLERHEGGYRLDPRVAVRIDDAS